MKRLIHSIIFLAVIVLLVFISMRVTGMSISQENVHFANERGLHYGPSDEILFKATGANGRGIVIGKCGDEGLSATHTKRYLGLFYKVDEEYYDSLSIVQPMGYMPCEKEILLEYDLSTDMVYGICHNSRIDELIIKAGSRGDEFFAQRITPDRNGFFCISDASSLYDKDSVGGEYITDLYAENSEPMEGTDICINSNMPRGLIVDRSELDKIIPEKKSFMAEGEWQEKMELSADELNKINAGIKKYAGIDFFATSGWTDGETVRLTYEPNIWTDRVLALTFVKDGANYVPKDTDENMEAAAIGWLKTNYGRSYRIGNILSEKIRSEEKDGKKQYRTMLSCDMLLKPEKVTVNDNPEARYGRTEVFYVEVVVEADHINPAAPWKMYYDDGLSGELRDIDELYVDGIPAGEISDEVILEFNELFAPTVEVSPGEITSTEISCFFTSYYDRPEDIDLAEFLRNCPLRESIYSDGDKERPLDEVEKEYQMVKEAASFELPDSINDMNTPVWRYRREVIDELLMKYAGITTADLTGKTSGRSEPVYVESTDSYYNFTSDYGPGTFEVVKGEKEGTLYYLRNERGDCLTLRRTEEGIKILSYTEQ